MLYSIGHSTRKAEDFVALLKTYGIQYLADVRSRPYSRFNPQYNQKTLKSFLELHGITYVFMGDMLGGRPEDPSCYDANGKISYDIVREKDFFKQGIQRLLTAHKKELPLAMMCSEADPRKCHRGRLIAPVLDAAGIDVLHIDETGSLKTHKLLMQELGKEKGNPELF